MKFSVITINRNNASGLEKTIRSVLQQNYKDFEYIIVDGASTDGSVDVIKKNIASVSSESNPKVQWLSEADTGIYNAMNKGIRMASGDYLLFLNSGDVYVDKFVLEKVVEQWTDVDVMIGRINFISHEGVVYKDYQKKNDEMTLFSFLQSGIPHQAALIRRALFEEYGFYDESLTMASDWKFFLNTLILHDSSYSYISVTISEFDNTGITSKRGKEMMEEIDISLRKSVPFRIYKDYRKLLDNNGEISRVKWLKKHPLFYKLYRFLVAIGRRTCK